jgi:hypothetical protein
MRSLEMIFHPDDLESLRAAAEQDHAAEREKI